MNIKNKIKKSIYSSVKSITQEVSEAEIRIEHPDNVEYGDYSSNIALILASRLKKNPLEIAKEIVSEMKKNKELEEISEKIEAVKPGFINISIKDKQLIKELERVIIEKEKYGVNKSEDKRKIMVEYTDPNPFKELHIGHLYSNIVGEALARLYESAGAEVKRANYQGDVGMHVAKSIWGWQKKMKKEDLSLDDLSEKKLEDKIHFLGQAYAMGANAFKEDKKAKKEIKKMNLLVYLAAQENLVEKEGWEPVVDYKKMLDSKKGYKKVKKLYQLGREWSLAYFEKIYERLGTDFDMYFFESFTGEYGLKIVKEYLNKGVFQESQGAIVFPGEEYGLHTRVFINSLGLPTYEAKDLGLAHFKYQKFAYDRSFIITGNEVDEYFKVVLRALKEVYPELEKKTMHISHGMVGLPTGPMSSRTGNVITGEWLMDQAKKEAVKKIKESKKIDSEAEEAENIAEMIAIGSVKYALLKSGIGKDVEFDFDKSISLQGNSGPYLQYTYARCKSVLRKANDFLLDDKNIEEYQANKEEEEILHWLYRFEEAVLDAKEELAPNIVCNFLFDLAQKYNSFYNKHRILVEGEEKEFRILLTKAVAHIIKNGLQILGILVPEKM